MIPILTVNTRGTWYLRVVLYTQYDTADNYRRRPPCLLLVRNVNWRRGSMQNGARPWAPSNHINSGSTWDPILGDYYFRQGRTYRGIEHFWNIPRKALDIRCWMSVLVTAGARFEAHHSVLTITAEGASSHTNHRSSTTTMVLPKTTVDLESYMA